MGRKLTGPTVVRRWACFLGCGHSHYHRKDRPKDQIKTRPVAYRDISYEGKSKIRVLRTVYVDQLVFDRDFQRVFREQVERLCNIAHLVLENNSGLLAEYRAELERRRATINELYARLNSLVDRAREEKHLPPTPAGARAGAQRTDSLDRSNRTPAGARAGAQRTDRLDSQPRPKITNFMAVKHLPPAQAGAKSGARRTDSL